MDYAAKFEAGLDYESFLDKYATAEQRAKWTRFHDSVSLTDSQRELLAGFVRQMKVIVLAGTWCGDCVNQCPVFQRFSEVNARIQVRYFDRDDHPDLADVLQTCGAPRVPAVLFLSEDNYVCGRAGDRTLAKYRQMANDLLGAACPSGITPPGDHLTADVVQEWLDHFERIQLMLRTSGRLRQLHGD